MRGKSIIGFACGAVLSLTAVGLAIAQDERSAPFPDYGDEGVPEIVFYPAPKIISCSPALVTGNQNLTVMLGPGHFDELAVEAPGDQGILLVANDFPPEGFKPFMTPGELSVAKQVILNAEIRAWRALDENHIKKIFDEPGRYRILNSRTFNSDESGYACEFEYRP